MAKTDIQQILSFLQAAEKLKTELRHCWTSDRRRQESVAEHTWMMSLIAICLFDQTELELDRLKVLKMIIIHDLVEVFAGDVPVWEKLESHEYYYQKEKEGFLKLLDILPPDSNLAEELLELWEDFERNESNESKFAKAIDKSEVLLQHNRADISSWYTGDYYFALREGFFDFDPFIRRWKNEIDKLNVAKVEKESSLDLLNPDSLKDFYTRTNPPKPRLSMIAAVASNRAIGRAGRLPWNIPSDLKRMRAITLGHPIIMGRKTFESIGRPLPERTNIVITKQSGYTAAGAIVVNSLKEALEVAENADQKEIFIFGGAEIYTLAIPLAERLYLTVVDGDIDGDTFFPKYDDFDKVLFEESGEENGYKYKFLDLERSTKPAK